MWRAWEGQDTGGSWFALDASSLGRSGTSSGLAGADVGAESTPPAAGGQSATVAPAPDAAAGGLGSGGAGSGGAGWPDAGGFDTGSEGAPGSGGVSGWTPPPASAAAGGATEATGGVGATPDTGTGGGWLGTGWGDPNWGKSLLAAGGATGGTGGSTGATFVADAAGGGSSAAVFFSRAGEATPGVDEAPAPDPVASDARPGTPDTGTPDTGTPDTGVTHTGADGTTVRLGPLAPGGAASGAAGGGASYGVSGEERVLPRIVLDGAGETPRDGASGPGRDTTAPGDGAAASRDATPRASESSPPPDAAPSTAPATGGTSADSGDGAPATPGGSWENWGTGLAVPALAFAKEGAEVILPRLAPLVETAAPVLGGAALGPALGVTAVTAGAVYLASKGEVSVVPVEGYDGTAHGTAPISAEVNGVRGTATLYRGATTDTPDLATRRTVTLGVDADGATLRDGQGAAVGRLEDGRVVPGEGVSVPALFADPAVSTPPRGAGLGEPVDGYGDGVAPAAATTPVVTQARPDDGATGDGTVAAPPRGGTGTVTPSAGDEPVIPGYGIPTYDDKESGLVLSMWAQGAGKQATETALENLRLGRAGTTGGGGAGGPPGGTSVAGGPGQGGVSVRLGVDGGDRSDAGVVPATGVVASSAIPGTEVVAAGGEKTAQVGRNEATWTVDAQGRPVSVEATLREVTSGAQRGSAELKAQTTVKALGLPDDDAGHIVGHRFMLDQGLSNLFPQNANLNRGAYKTFENEVADWIKAGGEVHFTANLSGGTADRPDVIVVRYEVSDPKTGRVVYRNVVGFANEVGQAFDRVPAKEMSDYLGR